MSQKAIKATTQEHLDIYTIKDHLIVLKDGTTALVLQISAINFGLLSEEEQDALIFSYASLLNSLSFPIQILIRSVKKDITAYLELLDTHLQETASQKLKEQIIKYRSFVRSLVKKNNVLEKKFYVVIPYGLVGLKQASKNLNPFAKTPQKPSQETGDLLARSKQELYPRRDHLIRQLARLGLQTRQLTTQELVTLFYRTYNPSARGVEQYLTLPTDYQTPAVQTKIKENYTPPTVTPPQPTTPVPPTPTINTVPIPPTPVQTPPKIVQSTIQPAPFGGRGTESNSVEGVTTPAPSPPQPPTPVAAPPPAPTPVVNTAPIPSPIPTPIAPAPTPVLPLPPVPTPPLPTSLAPTPSVVSPPPSTPNY